MMHMVVPDTSIQSHMVSIHSPHSTRNTMRNEWKKSLMCQRGRVHSVEILHTQSLYFFPNSCMPTTAKMKTIMARTSVRLPKAPTELPIILISVLRVGHDLASLKTLSCKNKRRKTSHFKSFGTKNEHIGYDAYIFRLTNLNDLRTAMPPTFSKQSSIKLKLTMIASKIFHLSWK